MKKCVAIFSICILAGIGCKDPYHVKVQDSRQALLVVEGFLNAGQGATTINLSRSFGLSDTAVKRTEVGANVTIEGQRGGVYQLGEGAPGVYSANLGALDASQQYRLHIRTAGGKEYASDYVTVQATPPIDSVNWQRTNEGVTIYANTHDASGNSKYYRWIYTETWETHSFFISHYVYDPTIGGDHTRQRRPDEMVYQCWKTIPSYNLNLATSTALKSDVIYEKPLVQIPNGDERLSVRYSILVTQFVLSKEAYDFFQLMKKNTESLGSVFDPLPSQVSGNIHAVSDRSEQVIGFFYASSGQQVRIFISNADVPNWSYVYNCGEKVVPPNTDSLNAAISSGLLPYQEDLAGFVLMDYRVSDPRCFDCTFTGGKTVRPDFW